MESATLNFFPASASLTSSASRASGSPGDAFCAGCKSPEPFPIFKGASDGLSLFIGIHLVNARVLDRQTGRKGPIRRCLRKNMNSSPHWEKMRLITQNDSQFL